MEYDVTKTTDPLLLFFWLCAFIGILFALIRTVITPGLLGSKERISAEPNKTLKEVLPFLTVRSLTGFIIAFGISGLIFYNDFQKGSVVSVLLAIILGAVTLFTIVFIEGKKH